MALFHSLFFNHLFLIIILFITLCFHHCSHALTSTSSYPSPRPSFSPPFKFNNGYDHRAHAVTGGPYHLTDTIGNGYVLVTLDASLSHSHYFNTLTGETGRIVRYLWQILPASTSSTTNSHTGIILCRRVKCNAKFPLGSTRLSLTVTDNTGDISVGYTKVIIYDGSRKGLRFLYYPNVEWITFNMNIPPKPSYSETRSQIDMYTFHSFPKYLNIANQPMSLRILGYLMIPKSGYYTFQMICGGASCRAYVGNRIVSVGAFGTFHSHARLWFKHGVHNLQVLYRRKYPNMKNPKLVLRWKTPDNGNFKIIPEHALSHRPALIIPVIHSVIPKIVQVGRLIHLTGSSFVDVRAVYFNGRLKCAGVQVNSQSKLKCIVPGITGDVKLTVVTNAGISNVVYIHVNHQNNNNNNNNSNNNNSNNSNNNNINSNNNAPSSSNMQTNEKKKPDHSNTNSNVNSSANNDKNKNKNSVSDKNNNKNKKPISKNDKNKVGPIGYYQPVRFQRTFLKHNGSIWKMPQLTSIAQGPDGRYYLGSLGGYVHAIGVDINSMTVTSHCRSEHIGTHRSILGLAFNPALTRSFLLYASTSVLYWRSKRLLLSMNGWANGEIIGLTTHPNFCLVKKRTIISGLPVSNYDHSVNALTFDNNGRLLVTIGCSTNAGLSKDIDDPMGGVADSPLSGSVIIADVLRKGFKGRVRYSQYKYPGNAAITHGGNDVKLFAHGVRNSFGITVHSNGGIYATDNGANPKYGPQSTGCGKSDFTKSSHEPDSLKRLYRGKWYGYANRNRGRWDAEQCIHIRPTTSIPFIIEKRKSSKFEPILAKFEASTNGILEYTANTFGSQLRGELIAVKFAVHGPGNTVRIRLHHDEDGTKQPPAVIQLAQHSGLSIAMAPNGALLMPRVYQGVIAVLQPKEWNPKRMVVTSVTPFRGPARGGNTVKITGWNLWPPVNVIFGNKPCRNVHGFKGDGKTLECIVPSGLKGAKVPVVVKGAEGTGSRQSHSYGFEYIYMNV